jgi:hypothetical protein
VRDNAGKCVWAARDITFKVSGPCTVFDDIGKPIAAIAGKIGIVLKSTDTPGAITVSASSPNLASDTVRLTSAPADESALPFIWPGTGIARREGASLARRISIRQTCATLMITAPLKNGENVEVSLLTLQGKAISCPLKRNGTVSVIHTAAAGKGIYFVKLTAAGGETVKKIVLMR